MKNIFVIIFLVVTIESFGQLKLEKYRILVSGGGINANFPKSKYSIPTSPFGYGFELNARIYTETKKRYRIGLSLGASFESYKFIASYRNYSNYEKVYTHRIRFYNIKPSLLYNYRIISKEAFNLYVELGMSFTRNLNQDIVVSLNDSLIATSKQSPGLRITSRFKYSPGVGLEIGLCSAKNEKHPMGVSIKYEGLYGMKYYYNGSDNNYYKNNFSIQYLIFLN